MVKHFPKILAGKGKNPPSIPCEKFLSPYLDKATTAAEATLPSPVLFRAANCYALGVIYHAEVDRMTLLCPWWNDYAKKNVSKRIKWSFSCLCVRVSKGRERVHQQLAFSYGCATANLLLHFKEAGQSLHLVHFPTLHASLPAKTPPGKMQLHFFSSFTAVMLKWKADVNKALGHQ